MSKPIITAPKSTGSTEPRDIRNRFADFLNVKDFGAVGDGVTDDSAAWTAWRTALQNGGMPYIPKGEYLVNNNVIQASKGHIGVNTLIPRPTDTDSRFLDEFNASIHVDATSGNDSNDGFSPNTAVKTISRGIEILNSMPQESGIKNRMYIYSGAYNEDIWLRHISIAIIIKDAVTINGTVKINDNSYVYFYGLTENSSLTINTSNNASLMIAVQTSVTCNVPINITSSNIDKVIWVSRESYFICQGNINISASNIAMTDSTCGCIVVDRQSLMHVYGNVSITGSSIGCGINTHHQSEFSLQGNFTTTSGITNYGIYTHDLSCAQFFSTTITVYGSECVVCLQNSMTQIVNFTDAKFYRTGTGACLRTSIESYLQVYSGLSGSSITFSLGSSTSGYCLDSSNFGYLAVNAPTMTFSGKCATTAYAHFFAILSITPSTAAISGSVTGKRYDARDHCYIWTAGGGETRIPGSTAGTVNSASFGYYY